MARKKSAAKKAREAEEALTKVETPVVEKSKK